MPRSEYVSERRGQDTRGSMTVLVRLARASGAAVLLLALGTAAASHVVPWHVLALGACALVGGFWRPAQALPWVLAVVPWGERLAPVPVRASEFVLWAFLAGLCLRLAERPAPASPWVRRLAVPALLFLGVAVVSWMRLELQQPGVPGWPAAAASILRLVPADYLVTAGRAPYTAAMLQVALAVSMFLVVVGLARRDVAVPGRVLFSVAAAGLLAAVLSVVAVPVVYFTTGDWNEIDRYISVDAVARRLPSERRQRRGLAVRPGGAALTGSGTCGPRRAHRVARGAGGARCGAVDERIACRHDCRRGRRGRVGRRRVAREPRAGCAAIVAASARCMRRRGDRGPHGIRFAWAVLRPQPAVPASRSAFAASSCRRALA